jgi:hypothetical protein
MSFDLVRVEFRVVLLERDGEGQPCGEKAAEGVVYATALDEFPKKMRDIVAEQNGQTTQSAELSEGGN